MFDFLKKNDDGIPPDVGKEDEYDSLNPEVQNSEINKNEPEEILSKIKPKKSNLMPACRVKKLKLNFSK